MNKITQKIIAYKKDARIMKSMDRYSCNLLLYPRCIPGPSNTRLVPHHTVNTLRGQHRYFSVLTSSVSINAVVNIALLKI